jgi:hypothetical protein
MVSVAGLAVLGMTATLAAVQTNGAMAQTPDAGCALPSEPEGIPAALDAAISGPADKDRACMKALLIPEARMMFVSLGADGTPSYRLESLDDWIARVKARGHAMLEEKQLKFHVERAQVRGNKSESADPGRYRPACKEKIRTRFHVTFEGGSNPQNKCEVHGHDDPVDTG